LQCTRRLTMVLAMVGIAEVFAPVWHKPFGGQHAGAATPAAPLCSTAVRPQKCAMWRVEELPTSNMQSPLAPRPWVSSFELQGLGMVFKNPVMRVRVQNGMAGVPAWRVVCLKALASQQVRQTPVMGLTLAGRALVGPCFECRLRCEFG
jgi:hypothetical protein